MKPPLHEEGSLVARGGLTRDDEKSEDAGAKARRYTEAHTEKSRIPTGEADLRGARQTPPLIEKQ